MTNLCRRCDHPEDWHRLDDTAGPWILEGTDPKAAPEGARPAEFRCIGYDCEADGPIGECAIGCPDFVSSEQFTVGDLKRLLEFASFNDRSPVVVGYEQFARRDVDREGTGFDEDGVLWIVAEDP